MKMNGEMTTRCELALMGKVMPVNSNDEVQVMTEYMLKAMDIDTTNLVNILDNAIQKYNKENEVKYIVCNRIEGMRCITYLIDTHDGETPAPFETDYGTGYPCAFSYVFNTECDWCSEFGDTFYEKQNDGLYHRVS